MSRQSCIAAQLGREMALVRLNIAETCPLTPVHTPGVENPMMDIPSRLFGSNQNGTVVMMMSYSRCLITLSLSHCSNL
jgi:hypothetical protein